VEELMLEGRGGVGTVAAEAVGARKRSDQRKQRDHWSQEK